MMQLVFKCIPLVLSYEQHKFVLTMLFIYKSQDHVQLKHTDFILNIGTRKYDALKEGGIWECLPGHKSGKSAAKYANKKLDTLTIFKSHHNFWITVCKNGYIVQHIAALCCGVYK